MVFSSIPAYLDPANWQQQANTNQQPGNGGAGGSTTSSSSHHQLPLSSSSPAPPPQPLPAHQAQVQASHGGGLGSIRPGSMADRARMSNIPMPETALKCPRCESTNTKFCYFNNYNLTQPRHFCKTCRRYWTRGGALRTVPVGGGCRRNKRSKSGGGGGGGSSSKSPAAVGGGTNSCGPSGGPSSSSSSASASSLLGLNNPQMHHPLRFMAPLSQLGEFTHGVVDIGLQHYGGGGGGMSSHLNHHDMNSFSLGGGGRSTTFLPPAPPPPSTGVEPWRFQHQISSFAGLEGPGTTGMFPLHGINLIDQARPKLSMSGLIDQMGRSGGGSSTSSVKMEESHNHHHHHHHQGLNLSRQFLGMQGNLDNHHQQQQQQQQYLSNWGSGNIAAGTSTSSWTDLSGFSSSSTTSNPL